MKKFFKIFLCAAMIFSFSSENVSAAVTELSDDNMLAFMTKCNRELKKNDPNNSLDTPALRETFKTYAETLPISDSAKVNLIYTTKNDKIYSIKLEANAADENVKNFFEGMNLVYLQALGLSVEEAKELTETDNMTEWRKEKFISTLGKKIIVDFKNTKRPILTILATDK